MNDVANYLMNLGQLSWRWEAGFQSDFYEYSPSWHCKYSVFKIWDELWFWQEWDYDAYWDGENLHSAIVDDSGDKKFNTWIDAALDCEHKKSRR